MTTRSPGGQRSERAREAILAATRVALAQHGYDRLSIDRVAAAAGVGKQTVYRWYRSKNALVAECILMGYVIPLSFPVPDTGDCRADVGEWVRAFAATSRTESAASLTRAGIAAAAEDPEIAARYAEVTHATQVAVTARLERGAEAGQLPHAATPSIVTEMLLGSLLIRVLAREEITDGFRRQLLDSVFGGPSA